MRVLDPRALQQHHKPKVWKRLGKALLLAGIVLVATNALLLAWYHSHTYPRTSLGIVKVGNHSFASVTAQAQGMRLPASLTLSDGFTTKKITPQALGLDINQSRTRQSLDAQRSLFPVVEIFRRHRLAWPVTADTARLQTASNFLADTFYRDPVDAKVVKNGVHFSATPTSDGHAVNQKAVQAALLHSLDYGQATVAVPTQRIAPRVSQATAQQRANALQHSLEAKLTYTFGPSSQPVAAGDIAAWYVPSGNSFALDDFAIRTAIAAKGRALGVYASNLNDAVAKTKQAVGRADTAAISLTAFSQTKTYRYCVASRGATAVAGVDGLKAKLVSTYADLRGWSLDGQVRYEYADSGCDFTVWLTAADQMTSFGAICDNYWNCEVDNNVVVNLDRWQQATPSWHAAGGNMEDYRVMLINHETGHMLGFGHTTCPGAGLPAPVMMQQSINLGGCAFNIWPVQSELAALRAKLDL